MTLGELDTLIARIETEPNAALSILATLLKESMLQVKRHSTEIKEMQKDMAKKIDRLEETIKSFDSPIYKAILDFEEQEDAED